MVGRRIEPPINCPTCGSPVPETARFCPVCQRPRRAVERHLRQAAEQTGTPYETLLQRAQDEDARNPQPFAEPNVTTITDIDPPPPLTNNRRRLGLGCAGAIVALFLFAIVLGALSGDDNGSDNADERNSVSSGSLSRPTATRTQETSSAGSELEYASALQTISSDMSRSMDTFSTLLRDPRIGDADWTVQVAAELVTWDTNYRKLQSLSPPPQYTATHNKMLEGMRQLTSAADDVSVGIDNRDASSIEQGTAKIDRATELILEAHELLPD